MVFLMCGVGDTDNFNIQQIAQLGTAGKRDDRSQRRINRVGHGRFRKFLRFTRLVITVNRIQGSRFVGQQSVIAFAAVLIILPIGTNFRLGIRQFNRVGQLNRGKLAYGNVHGPSELFLCASRGIRGLIGQNVGIYTIVSGTKTVLIFANFCSRKCFFSHCHCQRGSFVDKFEVVVIAVANHINNFGAGIQQIVNVVLDFFESHFAIASFRLQVIHECRSPRIVAGRRSFCLHNVAVIPLVHHHFQGLRGLVHGYVHSGGQFRIAAGNMVFLAHAGVGLDILLDFIQMVANIGQVGVPVLRDKVVATLVVMTNAPTVIARHNGILTSSTLLGIDCVCFGVKNICQAIRNKNHVLPVGINTSILVEHFLASQQASVGVCTTANIGFDRILYCRHIGIVQFSQFQNRVCNLIENDNTNFDLRIRFRNLRGKVFQHRNHFILDVCAGRLVQDKDNVGNQLLIRGRQGQRHLRLVVFIKVRCGLRLGNFPLNFLILAGIRIRFRLRFRIGIHGPLHPVCKQVNVACHLDCVTGVPELLSHHIFPVHKGVTFTGHCIFRNGCNLVILVGNIIRCFANNITGTRATAIIQGIQFRIQRNNSIFFAGSRTARFVDQIYCTFCSNFVINRFILQRGVLVPNIFVTGERQTVKAHRQRFNTFICCHFDRGVAALTVAVYSTVPKLSSARLPGLSPR